MNDNHTMANKAAWEEAFDRRVNAFGEDHAARLLTEDRAFLHPVVWDALEGMKLQGESIGQFCCNNGRELMSVVKHASAREGIGFDLAGNILAQARGIAAAAALPCSFIEGDACQAPEIYHDRFALVLITIGALCWMKELPPFFDKVAACLQSGGHLLIHEAHPITNTFAVPQEEEYDAAEPARMVHSYFRRDPFVDSYGMGYLAGETYESKPFISFSHTLGSIVTAVARSGLRIERLQEYNEDISGETQPLDGKGVPLSYLLLARKV